MCVVRILIFLLNHKSNRKLHFTMWWTNILVSIVRLMAWWVLFNITTIISYTYIYVFGACFLSEASNSVFNISVSHRLNALYLWRHIYMQIHSLPAGGAVEVVEIELSLATAVHKAALRSQTVLYQTLHARWNENDIQNFLKTVGFLQKYSDMKTPAPGFDFETCSARLFIEVKAFWKIYLWRSVLILWLAATNKLMCGKHWICAFYQNMCMFPGTPWPWLVL